MLNVLVKRLQPIQISFLSKLAYKVTIQDLVFNKGNYFNVKTTSDLKRYRTLAAYLKLIYVIRYNKARSYILTSYFSKFKELIDGWEPPKKTLLNRIVSKVNWA